MKSVDLVLWVIITILCVSSIRTQTPVENINNLSPDEYDLYKHGQICIDTFGQVLKIKNYPYSKGLYILREEMESSNLFTDFVRVRSRSLKNSILIDTSSLVSVFEINKKDNVHLSKWLRHGIHYSYRLNGDLINQYSYYKGKLDGLQKLFDANGMLICSFEMKNGRKHGVEKSYFSNGSLYEESSYQNGIRHGKTFTYFEGEGENKDGGLETEANWSKGRLEGDLIKYDQNGEILSTTKYKSGRKIQTKD